MDVVVASAPPTSELGGESGRSSPSPTASPEFEFWMVGRNPGSFPSPALLTADELFSGGIVLPLHTLQPAPSPDADADHGQDAEPEDVRESSELPEEEVEPATQPLAEACAVPTPDLPAVTFKWKDIFKATGESKERAKKSERRASSSVSGNAELININIWPFSRSRSAGHSTAPVAGAIGKAKASSASTGGAGAAAASAPAAAPATAVGRKVSSAPCSRSNSRGETSGPAVPAVALAAAAEKAAAAQAPATSMLRRLVPGGQGRAGLGVNGIRLGRASPVWQLRRNKLQQQQAAAEQKQDSKGTASAKSKAVPEDAATSQTQTDAGEEDKDAAAATSAEETASVSAPTAVCRNNAAVCSEVVGEECNPPQGLFGLRRTFFSKKVY